LDVLEPLLCFCHEGIFGAFVGGFVGRAEAEECTGIIPWNGGNQFFGNEPLRNLFRIFECEAGSIFFDGGFRRFHVQEERTFWFSGAEACFSENLDQAVQMCPPGRVEVIANYTAFQDLRRRVGN